MNTPTSSPAPRGSRLAVDELLQQQAELTDALEALMQSEREYRSALEALPLLMVLHDEGVVRFANAAFLDAFQRTTSEVVGRPLTDLFPDSARAALASLLAEPKTEWKSFELGLRGPEPQVLWARGGGVMNFEGAPRQLFLAADSTRETAVLQRAQRSEDAAGVLLDALPDLVLRFGEDLVLKDLFGGVTFPEAARLRTLVGLRLRDVQRGLGMGDGPEVERVAAHAARALATQTPGSHPQRWQLPGGEAREYLIRYVPCPGGLLVISSDRTKVLEDEQRLERAERLASSGELAAGVATEVEAPVSMVLERLHELKAELQGDAVVEEMLAELVDASVRIRDTATRLREYSSVRPSVRELVAVEAVVERAARMTANELRYRARLELSLEPGLVTFGDAAELEQVFVTLLTAAAKAMPEAASPETHHVWVQGTTEGDELVVSVMDDGSFVAPSALPRLFEPFAERSNRTSAGLGLALARCQRSITAHGGSVDAVSEPGRTRMVVRLPRVKG